MSADVDPRILGRVEGPAIALMVLGAINLLSSLGVAAYVLVIGLTSIDKVQMGAITVGELAGQLTGMACSGVMSFAFAILLIVGGMKMKNLQSWGLAMAAAVVGMLPCTSCCVIGLPIGIWCIITLNDDEIKEAFGQAALG